MRILRIDDDKDDLAIFAEAVNRITNGILCKIADNGPKGLDYLTALRNLPGILFLDIRPVMGGETLQVIRSNRKLDTPAVVIYSTSDTESDITWSNKLNEQYLVKPCNFSSPLLSRTRTLGNTLMIEKNKQIIRQAC